MSLDYTLPNRLSTVYATDEEVFKRCSADYPELVPEHQVIAAGTDGAFTFGLPWMLSSPSVDFILSGVQPNQVLFLDDDGPVIGPDGDWLAVAGVAQHTLTLRRVGMLPGAGMPPVQGVATGLRFRIATFGPQLENASYDINQRLRIDPASPFWNPDNLYDVRELQKATAYAVIVEAYTNGTRSENSDWSAKRDLAARQQETALSRLAVKWGPLGDTQAPNKANVVRLYR